MNPTALSPTISRNLTRRQALASLAAAAGVLAVGATAKAENSPAMGEIAASSASATRTSLHYDVEFASTPERIYKLLLGSDEFAAMTGLPAAIDAREGGAFSMFGGLIFGRNVELVPNLRIVQAWHSSSWAAGIYSIVKFEMESKGTKTRMQLDHTGFPEGKADHLDSGWNGHYLKPMAKLLG